MPSVTPALLLRRVREYADQADEGDGSRSFVTDNMIYSWLSKGYRNALRAMVRGGYPIRLTEAEYAAPGPMQSLDVPVLAVVSVSVIRNTRIIQLPRVPYGREIYTPMGTYAHYWKARIAGEEDGVVAIDFFPNEELSRVRISYVREPDDWDQNTANDSLYLPSSWEDVVVLGAVLRCLARTNEDNQMIRNLYAEALAEAENDTSNAMSENVVRNTDDIYPPGHDQGMPINGRADIYDYGAYIVP